MEKLNLEVDKRRESQVVPIQDTSIEIWDSKYRLKTKDGAPLIVQLKILTSA